MDEQLETISKIDVGALVDTYVIPWGLNIIFALLIFIIGKFLVNVITNLVKKLMGKAHVDAILINFIGSIVKSVLLLFVVIASLNQLGVDTTSLIALIGAAGLAIGLALQGSLQNLASGVMLIVFRPFTDGDFVEAGGTMGVVEQIGIFTTMMRTGDNKEVIVPNGQIFGGIITNYSKRDTRRVDMVFGIGYGDDIRKAKDIIAGIVAADERILKDPAPLIAVGELADSSVNFNVRPWVKSGDYWGVYFDLNEKIKLAFDENGISIPFPQMDVYLQKTE
ncbi:MAG: mechanosensitive ion channel [Gammaproteobacteria bacterium]|nr:mechanosensitive ion channel [Gammaproteobacteria bacterium]NNJ98082.1 mechanosensitive ion channel [Gammaproteobacteria bacterium]